MSHKSKGNKKLSIWMYQTKSGLYFCSLTEIIFGQDGSYKGNVATAKSQGYLSPSHDFRINEENLECSWREDVELPVETISLWFGVDLQPDPASTEQSNTPGTHGPTKGSETGAGHEGQSGDHQHHSHYGSSDDGVNYGKGDGGSRTITPEAGGAGTGTQTGGTSTEEGTGTATETQTAQQSGHPEIG